MHTASLRFGWKPFVSMLWGALSVPAPGSPVHCLFTKQADVPLRWIGAFLAGKSGSVRRFFPLAEYLAPEAALSRR